MTNEEHTCIQEARLTAIETKLENKKEHLQEVDEDYSLLREKIDLISINVAELTAIMKEAQKKEEANDKKVDELTIELAKANMEISKINSSLDTLKWGLPVACSILMFLINYLT